MSPAENHQSSRALRLFGARLADAMEDQGPLCVGIDPHPGLLDSWGLTDSAAGLRDFALRTVDAVGGRVAAEIGANARYLPLDVREERDWEAALPDPYACSGAELARVLAEHPHEQYIWAVFSAFAPDIAPQQIDLRTLPDAESADFWQDNPKPQHPQALFEIVCWDSTCTLFIGLPDKLAQRVVAEFPECRTLDKTIDEAA